MSRTRHARPPRRRHTCSICGAVDHNIITCSRHACVGRVRLEQLLATWCPGDWLRDLADWDAVRERIELAVDASDLDVDLALAIVEDAYEAWPRSPEPARFPLRDRFLLAPAWSHMLWRAVIALRKAAA